MRKEKFPLPSGCQSVEIEFDCANKISNISFSSYNPCENYNTITGHIEEISQEGDLSILWDNDHPDMAIIAHLKSIELGVVKIEYTASNNTVYENAIRFRDEVQYQKILEYGRKNHKIEID